ncbi:hypothetical protein GMORB2_2857 [Geosmithia morbida]|uniref:Chaperone-binding protein n=1 Tax=Geosmithia morbida TaxID=1094350 RepID=A0A9P4YSE1_9HYPO|nr:uncharacterized protein GMORB2_2857 [Geosmithia morbida]KAF4120853.1 hypothetical protein GMORB2_2857 [Geosmithia morbida]
MVSWEWDPNYVPPVKLGLHSAQIVVSFVLWCMELAVFADSKSKITGRNGWTFGVCFLSIPAWIYLVCTPRFARTRRFAQAHAMLAVDVVFTIIWISAFATQAAYNSEGKCGNACKVSKGIVGLGVVNFLLFTLTTLVSGYTLQYYKFHGNLPGYDNRKMRAGEGGSDSIDPDKAAFSMAPHDDEAYERINHEDNDTFLSGQTGDSYGNANPYSADDYDATSRFGSSSTAPAARPNHLFDADTEYNSAIGGNSSVSGYSGRYDDPAQFPAANYDRIDR